MSKLTGPVEECNSDSPCTGGSLVTTVTELPQYTFLVLDNTRNCRKLPL
jgi:hypothetical protein